jgi:hypothetical protein
MSKKFSEELAVTGEKLVQFGMNVFVQPKGFTFGKPHNIVAWRKQARERRERLVQTDNAFDISGQELNPQNQKQQLTAKVDAAKRPQLAQLANKFFPTQPVKLEHLFDPAERKGTAAPLKPTAQQISVVELRERVKAAILAATGQQLKQLALTVNSLLRDPSPKPGLNEVARPVIEAANQKHEYDNDAAPRVPQ